MSKTLEQMELERAAMMDAAVERIRLLDGGTRSRACPSESTFRKFAARLDEILHWADVPPVFIRNKFARPGFMDALVGGIRGAFLHGPAGTGKTTMAVSLLIDDILLWGWRNLAEDEALFRERFSRDLVSEAFGFISFPDLVMKLQHSWRDDNAESAKRLVDDAATVGTLVLDDVGAEKTTDFARQSLYLILNRREGDMRKTTITSNDAPDVLDARFDQRISSRLVGLCQPFLVDGKDRRMERP